MRPTLQTKTSKFNLSSKKIIQSGFTLIEIMIVLMLLAGLLSITLPKLRPADKVKGLVRKITVLTKQTFMNARLRNRIQRFVITFDEKNPTLLVEAATKADVQAILSEAEDAKPIDNSDSKPRAEFETDKTLMVHPLELPDGFIFEDVEYGTKKEKIKKGKAYIYFYPQGFATHSAIHISDGKEKKFTIIIQPLTGQSFASPEYTSLQEYE